MPFFALPTGGASPVIAGNGAPNSSLGNIGDLFIDTANAYLYGPKELAGWGTPIDLSQGPTGPSVTGPTGPAFSGNFSEIPDVALQNVTANQLLSYNGTAWTNSDLPTFSEITNGTASVTGNLTLNASTGSVTLNGGTAGSGSLTLNCEQNTHGVTIQSPPHSAGATYTLTLPTSDGSSNQVLQTDGNGSLSWADQSAGGGGITWASEPASSNSTGNAGQIAYGSGFFYLHDGTEWRRAALSTFGVAETFRLLAENGDTLLTETGDTFDTSVPATITITSQPQNATAAGGTASFSVTATVDDSSTLSYQWQEFTGTIWANIAAATSSTLSLGGLTSSDDGNQYRVNIGSDTAAAVTSDVATLTVATGTAWSQVGSDLDGASASNQLGYAVALAGNGTTLLAAENQSVRLYTSNGTAWTEDGTSPFLFGGVMSPSNTADTVLASSEDGLTFISAGGAISANMATVSQYSGGSWSDFSFYELGVDPSRSSVAISRDGQYVVLADRVGSISYHPGTAIEYKTTGGFVRAYDISGGSFSAVGSNITYDPFANLTWRGSGLGLSISDGGDVVSFGRANMTPTSTSLAYPVNGEEDAVEAYAFEYTGTAWVQRGSTLTGTTDSDRFGWRTSLSGDGSRLAVGAPHGAGGGTQRGYVRVYSWTGSAWSQMGSDVTGVANYDYFGWSVHLSQDGSRLVVGARGDDGGGSNAGTARVFDWTGSAWQQVGGDIDGEASNDFAGSAVAIASDGTHVAVGAPGNDAGGSSAGQARVFEYT